MITNEETIKTNQIWKVKSFSSSGTVQLLVVCNYLKKGGIKMTITMAGRDTRAGSDTTRDTLPQDRHNRQVRIGHKKKDNR